jgi:hypothetical protein
MQQRQVMTRMLTASGVLLLVVGSALAQPVFQAAPTYPLTGSTSDATALFALIDVGSQDGPLDGILDVVVAEQNQFATVLFGNGQSGHGDGTFGAAPNTVLGRIPSAMVVADFDDDQIPDLLVGDTSNSVAFFKGTASVETTPFEAHGDPVPAGIGPVAIAAADVNGDGKVDAIVVDEGNDIGGVKVLLGGGDGNFAPFGEVFPTGRGSSAVAVADFNRDGKLDLAVANKVSNTVTILRGAGTGFFVSVQTIDVGEEPIAIMADDFNGDGQADLAVTNRNSDNIAVIDGLANGSLGVARYFVSGGAASAPTGLALGDVNHDGIVDLLVPNRFTSDASVLLGDGHGDFAAPRTFVADQEPLAVAAGDVDGDGLADVVCVNRGSQGPNAAVLISRGDGGLLGVEDVVALPGPNGLVSGDVDNDGVADLILGLRPPAGVGGGLVAVYRATPPLGFAAPVTLQSAGDAVAVGRGDFNGDGFLDIVVLNESTNDLSVFIGQAAGGFAAARNYAIGSGATAVAVGDWNQDGRSDLAVAEHGTGPTGAVEILLAAADGEFGAPKPFPVGISPVSIDYGDFNEDGKPDLAVANIVSGDISILKGNGDGTFSALSPISNVKGPRALVVADFDADHHDDLAVLGGTSQAVLLFFGNGQGGFTLGPSSLSVETPLALAARDINGDSIPDVLVSEGGQANAVAMFRSLGTNRRFRQEEPTTVSRQPIAIIAADFNGDGRYDGAAADNSVAGAVSVLTNIVAPSVTTPAVLRGDGNGDAAVTAADAVAVMRELGDGNETRVEAVKRGGLFSAAPGVDANGDGIVTFQDSLAVAHRLF